MSPQLNLGHALHANPTGLIFLGGTGIKTGINALLLGNQSLDLFAPECPIQFLGVDTDAFDPQFPVGQRLQVGVREYHKALADPRFLHSARHLPRIASRSMNDSSDRGVGSHLVLSYLALLSCYSQFRSKIRRMLMQLSQPRVLRSRDGRQLAATTGRPSDYTLFVVAGGGGGSGQGMCALAHAIIRAEMERNTRANGRLLTLLLTPQVLLKDQTIGPGVSEGKPSREEIFQGTFYGLLKEMVGFSSGEHLYELVEPGSAEITRIKKLSDRILLVDPGPPGSQMIDREAVLAGLGEWLLHASVGSVSNHILSRLVDTQQIASQVRRPEHRDTDLAEPPSQLSLLGSIGLAQLYAPLKELQALAVAQAALELVEELIPH